MEAREAFQLGQRFTTRYEMSGKQLQCRSQITRFEEGRLLELQHGNCSGKGVHGDIKVIECITVEEKDGRTIVAKDVQMTNHGIPWFFVPLIWFINRFGQRVGKDRLKELCEGEAEQRIGLLEEQGVLRRPIRSSMPGGEPVDIKGGPISGTVSRERDERS